MDFTHTSGEMGVEGGREGKGRRRRDEGAGRSQQRRSGQNEKAGQGHHLKEGAEGRWVAVWRWYFGPMIAGRREPEKCAARGGGLVDVMRDGEIAVCPSSDDCLLLRLQQHTIS